MKEIHAWYCMENGIKGTLAWS